MIFVAAITVPKSTAKGTPQLTQIQITRGTITQVMVWFPPGVNGLSHIKLLWGLYQLFPSNEQGDFTGGNDLLSWPEDLEIPAAPFQVTAITWNDDTANDHTLSVHVVMQPAAQTHDVAAVLAQVQQMQSGSPA
jgi:hypothetical protein